MLFLSFLVVMKVWVMLVGYDVMLMMYFLLLLMGVVVGVVVFSVVVVCVIRFVVF